MKWIPPAGVVPRSITPPLVLIADEDAKVLELLQITLTSQHLRVITALDGDEAIRRSLAERPDLVVLEVRLPRKNGFEVCDWLRHDPEDPQVPVVLMSASGDTETRLEALARGADDFLGKPFSPKELVARVKRLLARSQEAREQRRRAADLERELHRVQEEARRAHSDMRREQRLRELAFGLGRDLHRSLDPDDVADRVLASAQRLLGCANVALLASGADPGSLEHLAVLCSRGDRPERFAALALDPSGEMATLVGGLGRPVRRADLDRFSSLTPELAPFVTAGVSLVVPIRTPAGLEALLVADDRSDGAAPGAQDLEALAALAELAAPAFQNAWRYRASQDRTLEMLAERAQAGEKVRRATEEIQALAAAAAEALALPARERALVRHAIALGAWAWNAHGHDSLRAMAARDATRRMHALKDLIEHAESLDLPDHQGPEQRAAMLITAVCVRAQVARASGRSRTESWDTATSWASPHLDPQVSAALHTASEHWQHPEQHAA